MWLMIGGVLTVGWLATFMWPGQTAELIRMLLDCKLWWHE